MTSAPRSASSMVAYGPASITPTSRMRISDSGPVICVFGSSRKRSSHLRHQLRNDVACTVFRSDQLVARLPDRQQTYRQIGDARVGELLEPRQYRLFVARRCQVADVAGVTAIEQLLVVGRRLGLGQDAVGAVLRGV